MSSTLKKFVKKIDFKIENERTHIDDISFKTKTTYPSEKIKLEDWFKDFKVSTLNKSLKFLR